MNKDTLQKQVNAYQVNIRKLDSTIFRLESFIGRLNAEAVIGDARLEKAYENLHEATGQRAIEESKFQRVNDELGLLLCKGAEKLLKPVKITEELHESCTCDTYEWSKHTCPHLEDIHDDHTLTCHCCPYCEQECFGDT